LDAPVTSAVSWVAGGRKVGEELKGAEVSNLKLVWCLRALVQVHLVMEVRGYRPLGWGLQVTEYFGFSPRRISVLKENIHRRRSLLGGKKYAMMR
jgi:hypothetical protein